MKTLHQDRFVKIIYAPEIAQIEHHWSAESYEMSEEDFKKEQLLYLEFAKRLKPKRGLVNSKNFRFTIDPQLQDWMNETLHPHYQELGLKKAAFLVPEDFFAQFSIEQIFDDYQPFQVMYFDKEENAREWLLN